MSLKVYTSFSLRELVDFVNGVNSSNPNNKILKEDIVSLFKDGDSYFLLYYK